MDARVGPEPERRESAAEAAYQALRADILGGALAEGERLTETALAARLGISRTPVREALNRLAVEGFVEREPGHAARVASFPEDEVEQIFQIRVLLESVAARRAAVHATEAEVAELRAVAEEIEAGTPPEGPEGFARLAAANERFHAAVMRAAKAHRLAGLLSVTVQAALIQRTYRVFSARDLERSARHHLELVEAIAARSPDWAGAVMTAHLLAAAAAAKRRPRAGERPAADG